MLTTLYLSCCLVGLIAGAAAFVALRRDLRPGVRIGGATLVLAMIAATMLLAAATAST